MFWAAVACVVFHTDVERGAFSERFPARRLRTERVVDHGVAFDSPVRCSRSEARAKLGLPSDRVLLLCIGFLSPYKGYERAIAAIAEADARELELHLVGSLNNPDPHLVEYVDRLRRLTEGLPHVHLHEEVVSDEVFDLWIRAADAVLAPYVAASSSGVVARAQLLGTTVIASGAGGIQEQLRSGDVCFSTDEELVAVLRSLSAHSARSGKDG
jgi:glycosyltransferase involved in cell wall biosynthesis